MISGSRERLTGVLKAFGCYGQMAPDCFGSPERPTDVLKNIYSIISLRGLEISGISELRGYLTPQKHCYFTHGSHLNHFEANVRSKLLLWSHFAVTSRSK